MAEKGPNRSAKIPKVSSQQEKAYGTKFVEQVCARTISLLGGVLNSISSPDDSRIKRAVQYALDRQLVEREFTPENPSELRLTPMQAEIRNVIKGVMAQRAKKRSTNVRGSVKHTITQDMTFLNGREILMPLVDDGTDTSQTTAGIQESREDAVL